MSKTLAPIVVMAGGTGGHIFPAMAVAKILETNNCPVTWIGAPNSMESRLVPQHGVAIRYVEIQALRGKGLTTKLLFPLRLLKAIYQAKKIVNEIQPAAVLGMGGFVTGPGGIAAWIARKPLLVHEQNAVAGMTNTYLAKVAKHVYEAFPNSFKTVDKAIEVGNPIRADIKQLHSQVKSKFSQERALRLLIIGGSLGALVLNETVPQAVANLYNSYNIQKDNIVIRHQAGKTTYQHAVNAYVAAGVDAEVSEFIDDMAAAYSWADIIICRAGALTVSEVSAAGLPAIFVPFPHAVDDHQRKNAEVLVSNNAAKMILQKELTAEKLALDIFDLIKNDEQLSEMSKNAKALAKLDAANIIAEQCLYYARQAA